MTFLYACKIVRLLFLPVHKCNSKVDDIQDNIEMNYAKGLIDEEPLPLRGIICDWKGHFCSLTEKYVCTFLFMPLVDIERTLLT